MSKVSRETIDEIVKRIDENVHEIKVQTTATNGRVRKLEVWRGWLTGAISALGIVIGYVWNYLTK